MTREEIIEQLNLTIGLIKQDGKDWLDNRDIPMLEECVKALSQEPCEDAISREWLMCKATERFYTTNYFNHISAMIEEAPSVTQKSKTGHWTRELIRNEKGGCIDAKMICSRCGNDNKQDEYMSHCPNCGTKMESEVNNG